MRCINQRKLRKESKYLKNDAKNSLLAQKYELLQYCKELHKVRKNNQTKLKFEYEYKQK